MLQSASMKNILLLLLIPFSVFAQAPEPVRHIDFASRNQSGFFAGEVSFSPKRSMLLATFNDFGEKAIYELVRLADGKTIASGALKSVPYSISWSEDEQMVAMTFKSANATCYETRAGMKELFTCAISGEVVFSRNRSILNPKSESFLYVFADDITHIYTSKGKLKDSADIDGYHNYAMGWFDILHNRFDLVSESNDELFTFLADAKPSENFPLKDATEVSGRDLDKDGAKYLCHSDKTLLAYDAATAKTILNYPHQDIASACFTPDGKNILLTDKNDFILIDLTGKQIASAKLNAYYSEMAYAGFGTELIGINPSGIDVYNCKNYFPLQKAAVAEIKTPETPVVNTAPVVKNEVKPISREPIAPKWTLPYKAGDFITPFNSDSFYLYSNDNALRYYVIYKKDEPGFLWKNPFAYYQYFGFSNQEKFSSGSIYIFDIADSAAKIGSYYDTDKDKKDQMIGGNNFQAKVPAVIGKTVNWTNKMYDKQYSLSSRVIDNVYKGKKAKCLLVNRISTVNGVVINETYYYQQGVGLIKIETGGKAAFERK